jgi:EmrB/QacA subfamily drug resistance transporter
MGPVFQLREVAALAVPRRVIVPLIVACALFMQNLDSTALATALPAIAESLGETPLRLHLAITSFMLSLAAFLPVSGWVADRFGARTIFRLAMIIFTLSSIACGMSTSFEMLLAARVVQGAGGALMVPVGRLILVRSVPKSELISAMALMGMPALVGPIIGPVLSGFIVTVASWRWIFWFNVPIAVLGIILVSIYIDDIREPDVKRFDWSGFFLSSFGLCGTLFGLDALTTHDQVDPIALGSLIGGLIATALYVFHARRVDNPILDLALLKYPTFRISVTGGSLFRFGVGAMPFLLPLMMQQGFGYTPLQSGGITFVSAAGSFGMRTISKRVLRRFGFRSVLIWNTLIASFFLGLCAIFTPETPKIVMMAIIFLGGVFRSLQFTALNTIGFAELDNPMMSQATSFSQMAQRLALSLGVAISAFVLHWTAGDAVTLPVSSFAAAFLVIGALSCVSVFSFIGLAPDAGEELAGRQPVRSRRFQR